MVETDTEIYLLIEENARKAEFREYTETYFPEVPFPGIERFSKVTVAPGQEVSKYYENRTMILPVTGAFDIAPESVLVPGEYWMLSRELTTLKNISESQEAVFLVFEFNRPLKKASGIERINLNQVSAGNMMPCFRLSKYREEKEIDLNITPSDCFIHVIAGNFEVEERYINQGDTLILLNAHKIELECLTEKGLFLFFST